MKQIVQKIKPKSGFSHVVYWAFLVAIPIISFALVKSGFFEFACLFVLASKWRMLAVRLRHWPAIIRANAIDIIASFSFLVFMKYADGQTWQLIWMVGFFIWLAYIKPRSSVFFVSTQAVLGQFLGSVSLYLLLSEAPLSAIVLGSWLICYLAARHFMSSFDERHTALLSYYWAYVAASITWIMGHWILYYGSIALTALILTILGLGLSSLYYLATQDRLSRMIRREIVALMSIVILLMVILAYSGDVTV
jgi:hypothetical protein